jgi:hypothetical protein
MNKSIASILGALILFVIIVLPRLPGVDLAVSPDEPKWLARSANFYRALALQDWAGTFQVEHPGVTVMYAGMMSFLAQYPELAANAPAPFAWDSRDIEFWLAENSLTTPLSLLIGGRLVIILLTALLMSLSFFPLRRLFGTTGALFAVVFASWSPLGLSLTQRLHPDSLLAIFLLLGLVLFLAWLYAGRSRRYLLSSAMVAALAGLTKAPAIFLVATVMLLMAIEWWRTERTMRSALSFVFVLAAWGGVAIALFVVLWPTMWVQPVETIRQIMAGMSVHAEGHSNPNFFLGQIVEDPGWLFYPVVLLFRTTPATLIGVVIAGVLLYAQKAPLFRSKTSRDALRGLLLFAVVFLIGMSLGGKKSDRYALPALLALDVVAAIGWLGLAQFVWQQSWMTAIRQRLGKIESVGPAVVVMVVLLLFHGAPGFYYAPYYFAYFNPLVGGVRTAPDYLVIGWGEGLDQAGKWLNEYDQGKGRAAVSGYATGSFSYFYDHDVFTYASNLRRDWLGVDYAVTYVNQWQRDLPDAETIAFFDPHTPIYVYSFRGLELARVYDLVDTLLPPNSEIDSTRIIDFGEVMRLLDFKISPEVHNPGDRGEVELYLKKIAAMENNTSVILRLTAQDGSEIWRSEGWPYGMPTSQWPLREVRRDAHALSLPSTLPDGMYKLTLGFYDNETLDPLLVAFPGNANLPAGGQVADLALLPIGKQPVLSSTAAPAWDFDEAIRLTADALPASISVGAPLRFTLIWQSLQPTPNRYTVFVHILDETGQLVAQQDREPQSGFAATQLWQPGMVFSDEYTLELPPDLPPGEFSVRVGLYDAAGVRLPLSGDEQQPGDAAEIGVFRIE